MTPMNDKQKEIALEMAVVRARMSMTLVDIKDYNPLKKELTELLAAFDAAADPPKRKYTVEDIEGPIYDAENMAWYIRCGSYVWGDDGWSTGKAEFYSYRLVWVVLAGLVVTGNVPEVGE